jgi:hypothetical protein
MDAATLPKTPFSQSGYAVSDPLSQTIDASAFRALLVSHRRMVRADRKADKMRGLRDLDTGEVFLTDERRLFDFRR